MKADKRIQLKGAVRLLRGGAGILIVGELEYKINPSNLNKSLDGDVVKANLYKRNGKMYAKVLELVKRTKIKFTGVISINKAGLAFFLPDDKNTPFDFFIDKKKLSGAKNGDKVVIKFTKWIKGKKIPNGVVIKVLGNAGSHEAEISSIISNNEIEESFSKEVLDEVEKISYVISEDEISKRRDFRDVTTFSIDGEECRDRDDALSVVRFRDKSWEIGIHISDVSFYVQSGSKLYVESMKRATSVYLVDRVLPMLPERLSNGICSLDEGVDRLTFSFIFKINDEGKILNEWFGRGVINSNKAFSYNEVQSIIENKSSHGEDLDRAISNLDRIAKKTRKEREDAGAFSFSKKESEFIFDNNNKIFKIVMAESTDSKRLIEDFMVMCNRAVGTYFYKNKIPAIFRIHDEPDEDKLRELSVFVSKFGYKFNPNGDGKKIAKEMNKLLLEIKGTSEESLITTLATRCMRKALCAPESIFGHFGLGKQLQAPNNAYSWITSPIRRFADLKNHEILSNVLPNKGYSR